MQGIEKEGKGTYVKGGGGGEGGWWAEGDKKIERKRRTRTERKHDFVE